MPRLEDLQEPYRALDHRNPTALPESAVDPSCLLAFDYEYPASPAEVVITTEEFTAVCPWTGLPDFGTLTIRYIPDRLLLELKSLKYYLLSYRNVGIVQEHAVNRILRDLVAVCRPREMTVTLDYRVRGGIHTVVTVHYRQGDPL